MKKSICLLLLLVGMLPATAQDKSWLKGWHAELGPMITVPIRYMHYYSVLGTGVDLAASRNITGRIYAGARINYAFFFGNGSVDGEEVNVNLFNAMADGYYLFDNNFLLGFSGGLGLAFNSYGTDVNFSRVFSAGYKLVTTKHDYVITAFFDQTNYQKNIGVRACMVLPIN